MQVEVEVEEAVEEVEVEEEQEEEEEDGLEEDPAHKLRSQDVDEGKGPPPDEAVDLEGCSGSQSCETGLACRPSDAPVFTGRGYETSGSLTRPPSPMEAWMPGAQVRAITQGSSAPSSSLPEAWASRTLAV